MDFKHLHERRDRIRVNELPYTDRPRERALRRGIDVLSDRELLAIIIRSGYQGRSALEIADELLIAYDLKQFPRLQLKDIMQIKGLKQAKALELLACFELSQRILGRQCQNEDVIKNSEALIKWLRSQLGFRQQEYFLTVFLDTKNHIISHKTIFIGSLDVSVAHPREIFKEAVMHSAAKLIVVHNHPSGDVTPSQKDLELTKILSQAGKMMGIPVIDHIIIGKNGYHSIMKGDN